MSQIGASLERLDDPRGKAPMFVSSPMIIKMRKLIPHQRANTRDPEIRNPALKGGEGSYITIYNHFSQLRKDWYLA